LKKVGVSSVLQPLLGLLFIATGLVSDAKGYYTTKGQDFIDKKAGEKVILRGFGIGCWLLPEGYMWGIRKLDRPRQFEEAIEDLIGKEDAAEFWKLYRDNFFTEDDVKAIKLMGANTIRIALLASMLQPRDGQPDKPPYNYNEEGFKYLDKVVDWCSKYEIGLIWDMHGAPGAQNGYNISDSDGQARLWTEKQKYWPMCIELWHKIVLRYKDKESIVGYDLLNEPLLRRYKDIDTSLLRKFYVKLTEDIRTIDKDGIIFIEGDDWSQNFEMLHPLDWDKHLVIAFHTYPPTSNRRALKRWDRIRQKYNIPLWHGETGEQGPPYDFNRKTTKFLERVNISWNWWTYKKMNRYTQPWFCPRTEGFEKILEYWRGKGPRPAKEFAKQALFEQAVMLNSDRCEFLPEMVNSLFGLNTDDYYASRKPLAPQILSQPPDIQLQVGDSATLVVRASGHPLNFQWNKNGKPLAGKNGTRFRIEKPSLNDNGAKYTVMVSNDKGQVTSRPAVLSVKPFAAQVINKAKTAPKIDGTIDETWAKLQALPISNAIMGTRDSEKDLSASFKMLWDKDYLYIQVNVTNNVKHDIGKLTWHGDCVEVYIDYDNSKSKFYGDDEFQFRYEWNMRKVFTSKGRKLKNIKYAQIGLDDGYIMEMAFPWSKLGGPAPAGKYIGIDVHVTDNYNLVTGCKIAWKATANNSYESPMFFGTMKLSDK